MLAGTLVGPPAAPPLADAPKAGAAVGRASAPAQPVAAAAPPAPAPAPVPVTPAGDAPASTAGGAAAARGAIGDLVAQYARAIESRDLSAVRAAYPGLTSDQERNFARFFGTVRTLRASFDVRDLDVAGATAEARLEGVYDFTTQGGDHQRVPVTFRAALRREGGAWQLMSVR
jgi:ketosteroid isomerase-like protein